MLSRLIQLYRVLLADPNGREEYAYLEMQYWAVSVSCLSVLAFFVWHVRQSPSNGNSIASKYGSLLIILYPLAYLFHFLLKTDGDLLVMSNLVYLLCRGVAAVILIQHILEKFPSCSSFGLYLKSKMGFCLVLFFSPCYTKVPFKFWLTVENWGGKEHKQLRNAHRRELTVMVFNYIFTDSRERLALCAYWIFVIYVSIRRFYSISKQSKTERILLRKYYHPVAVLIFSPAIIFQVWEIYPLGNIVHQFMSAFTDHRDSEILIVSHFSLLLGCALPKWMSSGFNDRPLTPFAGILSLGIGDTMASMIGYKYGVLRWSKTGKKTIEGTAAGITSALAACSILLSLLASSGYILSQHWISLLVAVTLSGLLEAYTAQLDNAFIPLVFYSLLCGDTCFTPQLHKQLGKNSKLRVKPYAARSLKYGDLVQN
uniref:dolichol kinase n=1 Tax=Oryza nivara TaxID=4536 RepID=A0A0E0G117_ORYNI